MFLTELDSRAAVQGSRDPLGLVPLWGYFGRKIVGNLTTVTDSVRAFTTTLLGYYFAREVQQRDGDGSPSTLETFLKFEQLAGYSRYFCAKDGDFRGVTYVKSNLEKGGTVWLSQRSEDQILSNQKIYGLWGLFTVASRDSGLLQRQENELTPAARAFVEKEYIADLSGQGLKDGKEIVELLGTPRGELRFEGKHKKVAQAIASLLRPKYSPTEKEFYRSHLVLGGPTDSTGGLQSQAAELMTGLPRGEQFNRRELQHLVKVTTSRGREWEELSMALQRIDHLESLLVPAAAAFTYLLARNGRKLSEVALELAKHWGPISIDVKACKAFRGELEMAVSSETAAAERWLETAEALASGKYEAVLKLLLEHNASIMQTRKGSAPWAQVSAGRLDVRFVDEKGQIPTRRELPEIWANNYFLNPLKEIVGTLAGA